jgi:hypothetical protein
MLTQYLGVAVTDSAHQTQESCKCVGSAHAIGPGSDAPLEFPNGGICGWPKHTVDATAVKAHVRQLRLKIAHIVACE